MQSYVYVRQLYDRSPVVYLISDRRVGHGAGLVTHSFTKGNMTQCQSKYANRAVETNTKGYSSRHRVRSWQRVFQSIHCIPVNTCCPSQIRDPDRYEGDTTSSSSPPCGHPARELLTHQLITAAYYAGCIDGRACRQQIAVMSDLRISWVLMESWHLPSIACNSQLAPCSVQPRSQPAGKLTARSWASHVYSRTLR